MRYFILDTIDILIVVYSTNWLDIIGIIPAVMSNSAHPKLISSLEACYIMHH